jgi:hypothetical protein
MADRTCQRCGKKLILCPKCDGEGRIWESGLLGGKYIECPHCKGIGWRCASHGNNIA